MAGSAGTIRARHGGGGATFYRLCFGSLLLIAAACTALIPEGFDITLTSAY
jgi:hypothetical protein